MDKLDLMTLGHAKGTRGSRSWPVNLVAHNVGSKPGGLVPLRLTLQGHNVGCSQMAGVVISTYVM